MNWLFQLKTCSLSRFFLVLCCLYLSGCAQKTSLNTKEYHQPTPQYKFDLSEEPLFLIVNNKKLRVGTKVTTSGIFLPNQTSINDSTNASDYFYLRGRGFRYNNTPFAVVGHTDSSGSREQNLDISKQRAGFVARILANQAQKKVTYFGFGEYLPKYKNTNAEGRKKNRRIELLEFTSKEYMDAYMKHFYMKPYIKEIKRLVQLEKQQKKARLAKNKQQQTQNSQKKTAASKKIMVTKKNTIKRSKPVVDLIEFGGKSYKKNSSGIVSTLGDAKVAKTYSRFSFFNKAHAASMIPESCLSDKPLTKIVEKDLKTSEYLPGMNNIAWWTLVNGHAVTISPVAIAKKGASPVAIPKISVYKDYKRGNNSMTFEYSAGVKVYEGEEHILYRLFPKTNKQVAIQCIDLLLPKVMKNKASTAVKGYIYYKNKYNTQMVNFLPSTGS